MPDALIVNKLSSMANRSIIKGLYPMQTAEAGQKISERILELMDMKGWDKARLALALGVHSHSLREWLDGTANFNLSTLIALEQVLNGKIIEIVNVFQLTEN